MNSANPDIDSIIKPDKLWSRSEVLVRPSPVPQESGLYAWYFEDIPHGVPVEGCVTKDGKTLLYVGISIKKTNGNKGLRTRVRFHYKGNAFGSTLRLALGVLLLQKNGFPLRRVGSSDKRKTFTHKGEQRLDSWMEENAFVCWMEYDDPCSLEEEILRQYSPPLNIKDNRHHEFSEKLSSMKSAAKKEANRLPIANEKNQQRSVILK